MRDEDILAAARAVRPVLPELVADGPDLDARLGDLLARAERGEPVADDILDALTAHDRVREWLRRLLPEDADATRGDESVLFSPLPGTGEPTAEIVFTCGGCDYAYPVFEVGEPVPDGCPHGHGPLSARR
jgi:hypothetical protein